MCKEDAPEHQAFNWQIWGEEILNTKSDSWISFGKAGELSPVGDEFCGGPLHRENISWKVLDLTPGSFTIWFFWCETPRDPITLSDDDWGV